MFHGPLSSPNPKELFILIFAIHFTRIITVFTNIITFMILTAPEKAYHMPLNGCCCPGQSYIFYASSTFAFFILFWEYMMLSFDVSIRRVLNIILVGLLPFFDLVTTIYLKTHCYPQKAFTPMKNEMECLTRKEERFMHTLFMKSLTLQPQ